MIVLFIVLEMNLTGAFVSSRFFFPLNNIINIMIVIVTFFNMYFKNPSFLLWRKKKQLDETFSETAIYYKFLPCFALCSYFFLHLMPILQFCFVLFVSHLKHTTRNKRIDFNTIFMCSKLNYFYSFRMNFVFFHFTKEVFYLAFYTHFFIVAIVR